MRGRRVWRSLSTRDAEEAEARFRDEERNHISWDRLTMGVFTHELVETILPGSVSKSTIELYRRAFTAFVRTVGDRRLKDVTPYLVESFKSERLRSVSASTVSIEFRVLRAAFGRALNLKIIEENPFCLCRNVRVPRKEPIYLSREDFKRLFVEIKDERLRSLVVIAVCTGMRLGELVHLKWSSIDLRTGWIKLENQDEFTLKTGRRRSVPMNEIVCRILLRMPRTSEYVFPAEDAGPIPGKRLSRQFKREVVRAGLSPRIHFHSLRHTAASWLVQSGAPLSYIQEILGHSSISTTMVYVHSSPEHLKNSVSRIERFLPE